MNVTPLVFEDLFKERVWGGDVLRTIFKRDVPKNEEAFGESWEISDHGDDSSVVAKGVYKGRTLSSLREEFPVELLGEKGLSASVGKFPLLLKFIDAASALSVQVHPDDKYAFEYAQGDLGKTEAWVVMAARDGACIYSGMKKGVTKEQFAQLLAEGKCEECLEKHVARVGQCYFIPAGQVHAIGAGVTLAEIQQNSDTTYRVFDWNRMGANGKPREIHVEHALSVLDFENPAIEPTMISEGVEERMITCDKFSLDMLRVKGNCKHHSDEKRFIILAGVAGDASVLHNGETYSLSAGRSVLIPASLGEYEIHSDEEALIMSTKVP